jgi:hypothetical protein
MIFDFLIVETGNSPHKLSHKCHSVSLIAVLSPYSEEILVVCRVPPAVDPTILLKLDITLVQFTFDQT